jgi:hypothetical protein
MEFLTDMESKTGDLTPGITHRDELCYGQAFDEGRAVRGRVHAVVRRHRETERSSLTPLQRTQLRVAVRRANPALRPKPPAL